MYERIIKSGKSWWTTDSCGVKHEVDYRDVYSADMREILHTAKTFEDAMQWLEQQVKMERLTCPTGGCEDQI